LQHWLVLRGCDLFRDLAAHLDGIVEIAVGTIAQLILGLAFGPAVLGTGEPWVAFSRG
jgi:hypothetical protein